METLFWFQYYQGLTWLLGTRWQFCYEGTNTANIVNYRKPDSHQLITPFYHYTAIKYYHLFWSYLCYYKHDHRDDDQPVRQNAQESLAPSYEPPHSTRVLPLLAHDVPEIQTQTSSSVCTELKEQDSDGFTRIFIILLPPPPTQQLSQSQLQL